MTRVQGWFPLYPRGWEKAIKLVHLPAATGVLMSPGSAFSPLSLQKIFWYTIQMKRYKDVTKTAKREDFHQQTG
jgi:hypothetical protein